MNKIVLTLVLPFALFCKSYSQDVTDLSKEINLDIRYAPTQFGDTIFFELTNNDKVPFTTTHIGTNYNRILIINEQSGLEFEHFVWAHAIDEKRKRRPSIQPGDKKVWEITPEILFKRISYIWDVPPGNYKVGWKVYNTQSDFISYTYRAKE